MLDGKRILTIDDSTTIRNYLRGVLTSRGADVDPASTGQEGLHFCSARAYDLILLDLHLPDMDGLRVLRGIRRSDDSTCIVMLTSEGGIKSATEALQEGADGYIEKHDVISGDHAEFFYALENALTRREAIVRQRLLQAQIAEKVEQLRASERRALEASRAKSVFLASMSHELRTPLNAILGFIQLMERDPALGVEQREHLAIMSRSGEHLLGLINDVLSLSKIESGQLTLNSQTFNIHRMLMGLEEMFRFRAQAKGLRLVFEIAPDLPERVEGDEGKLRQVLINLLGNAFKFTEFGGVALRARWDESVGFFEVEDTGQGIAPEEIHKVFEAFVQTESGSKSVEGTGLGLTISRSFVQLMGGDITVRSQPRKGTTFSFDVRLPLSDEAETRVERRRVIALSEGQRGLRVLVVDDKWDNRMLLMKLLRLVGFDVREATNGREAIDAWRAWKPDFIWMDMLLPVMDGFTATRRIRELEEDGRMDGTLGQTSRVPIVALSASVFEQDRQNVISAGCDDFVAKPFREETIFEKLAELTGCQFVYEDARPASTPTPSLGELTRDRLAALPAVWRAALNEAVQLGDVEGAYKAIEQVRGHDDALAEELRSLVRGYRFDDLVDLLGSESISASGSRTRQ